MMIFSPQGELVCYDEQSYFNPQNAYKLAEEDYHAITSNMTHKTQFNFSYDNKCFDCQLFTNEYGKCYIVSKNKIIYRIWYYPANCGCSVRKILDCRLEG